MRIKLLSVANRNVMFLDDDRFLATQANEDEQENVCFWIRV